MKYFKKLVGERVYLSPMNAEDLEQYTKWLNDPAVTDGLGNTCMLFTLAAEKKFLEGAAQDGYQFAIVRSEDDALIGNCGIQEIEQIHRRAKVGLFIGEEENRGRGYGAEVLGLLLDYCFDTLNLHHVSLGVFSFNERAIACYRKVGFREAGRLREFYFLRGKYHDGVAMDILEDEWRAKGV